MKDWKRHLVPALKLVVVPIGLVALILGVAHDARLRPVHADPWLLVAALAVNQVALLLFAARMSLTLRAFGVRIGLLQSMRVHLQSMFYFFALPMTVGLEVARFAKIKAMLGEKAPGASLTYALLTDRVGGALAAALIAVALLPWVRFRAQWQWNGTTAMLVAAGLALAGVAAVLAWRRAPARWRELARAPQFHPRGLAPAFAVALVTHACFGLGVYLAAVGTGVEIGALQTLFAISAAMLFVVLPVSFAGVSPVEAASLGMLAGMGLPLEQAALVVLYAYLARLVAALEGATWEILEGGGDLRRALLARRRRVAED